MIQEAASTRNGGPGVCLILLDAASFSFPQFLADCREDWSIAFPANDVDFANDMLVTDASPFGGSMLSLALIPAPIPDESVIENAKTNFRWPKAVEVVRSHKAHLIVAVTPGDAPLDSSVLLVKLCATALKQSHATGINTLGTVFSPAFYRAAAQAALEQQQFPIMNLVFFGIYSPDNGKTFCGYAYGMQNFGKQELEVLNSKQDHGVLLEFLMSIAEYVIVSDVLLRDGETIGFSENEKLPITESFSDVLKETTLKIGF